MPSCVPGGRRLFLLLSALPLLLAAASVVAARFQRAESADWKSAATGEEAAAEPARVERTPWTTSRVVGSPEPPPPFKVVRAFPNLKFEHPLLIARPPGSDRLFVGEQAGVLYSFADRPDARADLFCDLRKEIRPSDFLHGAK